MQGGSAMGGWGPTSLATLVAAAFATLVAAAAALPVTTSSRAAAVAAIAPASVAAAWARRLCLVLVLLQATGAQAQMTDVFSTSWTTECSGSSATWAEVCGTDSTTVTFTAEQGLASAVVLADIARVGQSVVDETIDLRLKIRQVAHPHDTAYVGVSSVRCTETATCAAPMLHGVVSNLTQGTHTATLEYKTASGTAYFRLGLGLG